MDIHIRKIQLVQHILALKDEQLLNRIEDFLHKHIPRNENAIDPMTVEELNLRIDQSEKDFENGKYFNTEELLEKYKA